MKIFLHTLYSIASLSLIAVIVLALSGHVIVTSEPRMVNVVDDHRNTLFQMATGIVDYRLNLVK